VGGLLAGPALLRRPHNAQVDTLEGAGVDVAQRWCPAGNGSLYGCWYGVGFVDSSSRGGLDRFDFRLDVRPSLRAIVHGDATIGIMCDPPPVTLALRENLSAERCWQRSHEIRCIRHPRHCPSLGMEPGRFKQ
jgi:hypothetical protein